MTDNYYILLMIWLTVAVFGIMLMAAPLAFILCLDQFSDKKIAQKLKGD